MKTFSKIVIAFVAVLLCGCKTMQEPLVSENGRMGLINSDATAGIKVNFYLSKRVKKNGGDGCPSDVFGICSELVRDNQLCEADMPVAYVNYDESGSDLTIFVPEENPDAGGTNPLYENFIFDGGLIVNNDAAIWDPEMLDALSLSEPVEILPGEYQFIEDYDNMCLKFELPVQPANLESGIVLYLTSADYPDFSFDHYVLDSFYVGYLGESFEPVAVVEVDYSNMRFLLHFPLSLNDNTSTSYFHQIFEDEYFSVPEGTKINNLEYLQLLGLRASVELMPDDYQVTIDNNEISVVIPFNYYYR